MAILLTLIPVLFYTYDGVFGEPPDLANVAASSPLALHDFSGICRYEQPKTPASKALLW